MEKYVEIIEIHGPGSDTKAKKGRVTVEEIHLQHY